MHHALLVYLRKDRVVKIGGFTKSLHFGQYHALPSSRISGYWENLKQLSIVISERREFAYLLFSRPINGSDKLKNGSN